MLSYGYSIGDSLMIFHESSKIILSPSKPRFVVVGTLSEIMEWMRLNGNLACEYDDNDNKDNNKDYYEKIVKDNNNSNVTHDCDRVLRQKKSVTFTNTDTVTPRMLLFELYTFSQQQQDENQRHHHQISFKSLFSSNKVDKSSSSSTPPTTIFRMVIKPEQLYQLYDGKYYTVTKEDDRDEVEEGYTIIKRSRCRNGTTLSHVLNKWTTVSDNHKSHHTKKSNSSKLGSDFDY